MTRRRIALFFIACVAAFLAAAAAIAVSGLRDELDLVAQGVPREAVLIDSAGIDTAATAANVARIGKRRQIRSVIVASQYFHIPRTRLALSRAGLAVVGSVHAKYFEARDIYSLAREVVGFAAYYSGVKGGPAYPATP